MSHRMPHLPSRPGRTLLIAVLLAVGCAVSFVPAKGAQGITLNLKNADINALISTVSAVTGKNFIVDPRVKAQVTVISKHPMNSDELYQVFLSILQVHGFSAVKAGPIIKIVPDINAKQLAGPTTVPPGAPGDEIVTKIIQVQNVPVAQMVPILRPLVPQQGLLAAYPPTNILIISDRASNIRRLTRIVHRIDVAGNEKIDVVPVKYASAGNLVRIITALQKQPNANTPPSSKVRLAADERTNSILMSGDPTARLRIRALIASLDTPSEGGGDTKVVYLHYAKAKDLVKVLTGVSQNLKKVAAASAGGKGASAPGNEKNVSIEADESANALVISAPPKILSSLLSVVRQLDIRRAEVLIEAAIAELSLNKAAELGLQFAADGSNNGFAVGTNFSNGSTGSSIANLLSIKQTGQGTIPDGLNLAVGSLTSGVQFGAFIRALASDSAANILSTPSLLTLDNQEAEIRVVKNVPFVTGSYTNTGSGNNGSINPFQTIERQDVGLILKVKPQINEGNAIQLDIDQEVSNLTKDTNAGNPITNKRSIKTSVLVDSGDLVVLGGLISNDVQQTVEKVPGLGDIPLLGQAFRYRQSQKQKQDLMVFLHPTIVRDGVMNGYTASKYDFIRAEQLAQNKHGIALMPGEAAPVLPPRKEPILPRPFGPDQ